LLITGGEFCLINLNRRIDPSVGSMRRLRTLRTRSLDWISMTTELRHHRSNGSSGVPLRWPCDRILIRTSTPCISLSQCINVMMAVANHVIFYVTIENASLLVHSVKIILSYNDLRGIPEAYRYVHTIAYGNLLRICLYLRRAAQSLLGLRAPTVTSVMPTGTYVHRGVTTTLLHLRRLHRAT
jgi:hypothetical protein